MRFLEGHFSLGPFHGFLNVLEKSGDSTVLHEHVNDHLLVSPSALKVEAIVNGEPREIRCEADSEWWNCWLIRAGVKHRVIAADGPARFICLFSHYDGNGRYNPDPKIHPGTAPVVS